MPRGIYVCKAGTPEETYDLEGLTEPEFILLRALVFQVRRPWDPEVQPRLREFFEGVHNIKVED